jgi:hypothetical protein
VIPPPRWRELAADAVGAALAFFAQPIALIALVGLAAFTFGRCSGHTDAKVQQWTDARDLHVGPLWEAFHVGQSADSATAERLLAYAREEQQRADSAVALLQRPPRHAPPAAPVGVDSTAYVAGYDDGYTAGWTEAADAATSAISRQRAANDSLMQAAAVLETARRAAVAEADTLRGLVKVAPIQKRRLHLSCGPGVSLTRHGVEPSVSCHLSR